MSVIKIIKTQRGMKRKGGYTYIHYYLNTNKNNFNLTAYRSFNEIGKVLTICDKCWTNVTTLHLRADWALFASLEKDVSLIIQLLWRYRAISLIFGIVRSFNTKGTSPIHILLPTEKRGIFSLFKSHMQQSQIVILVFSLISSLLFRCKSFR